MAQWVAYVVILDGWLLRELLCEGGAGARGAAKIRELLTPAAGETIGIVEQGIRW